MAENSNIQWTDHTFNPWRGCTEVSPGCANCYARQQAKRNPRVLGEWGRDGTRVAAAESQWQTVRRWNADADPANRPRVFTASFADVLEWRDTMPRDYWDVVDDARVKLFNLVAECPNLDFLFLTKRIDHWETVLNHTAAKAGVRIDTPARRLIDRWLRNHPPRNVWLGATVENNEVARERVYKLGSIPSQVHFLSCEPLLSALDLTRIPHDAHHGYRYDALRGQLHGVITRDILAAPKVQWVIVGGESGAFDKVRPFHVEWARSLVKQCTAAGVPVFVKQMGSVVHAPEGCFADPRHSRPWGDAGRVELKLVDNHGGNPDEWPEDIRIRQFPTVAA